MTRAKRCKKSVKRKATGSTPWLDGMSEPCDPSIFRTALEAWVKGMDIPLRDPSVPLEPGSLYLTDIPVNRAAMSAMKTLREAGVTNPQGYLWRLLHMAEIFDAAPRLGIGDMVRDDGIHTALLRAAAVANLATLPREAIQAREARPTFDLADVAAKARQFRDEEAAPA